MDKADEVGLVGIMTLKRQNKPYSDRKKQIYFIGFVEIAVLIQQKADFIEKFRYQDQ